MGAPRATERRYGLVRLLYFAAVLQTSRKALSVLFVAHDLLGGSPPQPFTADCR